MTGKNQKEIMSYLHTVESANIKEIYNNIKTSYYCNETKHLGKVLSNMVNKGYLIRVKKGTYKVADKWKIKRGVECLQN